MQVSLSSFLTLLEGCLVGNEEGCFVGAFVGGGVASTVGYTKQNRTQSE